MNLTISFPFSLDRNRKIVDEEYLNYVRLHPCLACQKRPVDADHLKARGWREAKRNDYSAIPLCRACHSERGQLGDEKFCEEHGIKNLWQELFYLLSNYMAEKKRIADEGADIEF